MEDAILTFPNQFEYVPEIKGKLPPASHFIVCGMGGSHLQADILRDSDPQLDLIAHSDYGLAPSAHVPPANMKVKDDTLFIACSYSGNTEEVLDFAERVHSGGYQLACISIGGKLLEYAQTNDIPYIELPDTGIQPRSAVGFALLALVQMVKPEILDELHTLTTIVKPENLQEEGKNIAESLKGFIPVIYSSRANRSIGYNWKITLNETGKVPAFSNSFPELNHNEIQGFATLEKGFRFIFIRDDNDYVRVQKRMDVCEAMFEKKGMEVISTHLIGVTYFERVFNSLILADWVALYTAKLNGEEPESVPLIEEFKKQL